MLNRVPRHRTLACLAILLMACGESSAPSRPSLGGSATITDGGGVSLSASADSAAWADTRYNDTLRVLNLAGEWTTTSGSNGYLGTGLGLELIGATLPSILAQRTYAISPSARVLSFGPAQHYEADSGSVTVRTIGDSLLEVTVGARLVLYPNAVNLVGPTPLRIAARLVAVRISYDCLIGAPAC
jgi:hypothetical protein